jgi:hypothetical protein
MSIKDFLWKKRNILIEYNIEDLKRRLTPMENVLALHFLNKIAVSNCQNWSDNTLTVNVNLSTLSNIEIFDVFLVYLENSIINYKKYENDKINQFLFFIDWYASTFGDVWIKKYQNVNKLYEKRTLK